MGGSVRMKDGGWRCRLSGCVGVDFEEYLAAAADLFGGSDGFGDSAERETLSDLRGQYSLDDQTGQPADKPQFSNDVLAGHPASQPESLDCGAAGDQVARRNRQRLARKRAIHKKSAAGRKADDDRRAT